MARPDSSGDVIGTLSRNRHIRGTTTDRSGTPGTADNLHEVFTVFKVGATIRQLELPLACAPTQVPDWVPDPSVLSGVYESDEGLFLVINLETILEPKRPVERHVS